MASIQKRISNDGQISFRVQVRLKGSPPETASFARLSDAKKWGQQTEVAIREGRYFKSAAAKKHTLSSVIDRYISEVLTQKKNARNQKIYLAYWKDVLGDCVLFDIGSALIIKQRNSLLERKNKFGRQLGMATANRYTQALGHVFTVAMKEWELISDNPVTKITKYKEPRGRVRFLSDEERHRLLSVSKESANPYLYCIVVLALSTGARKMEVLNLKWSDVNFERNAIILHETKNGERRVIPLHSHAMSVMKEHAKNKIVECDWVFPTRIFKKHNLKVIYQPIDIRTAWETVLLKAEVLDFRFHDLRHSAASYLAMNGASMNDIAEVLGHKTLQMVKRYAHLSDAHTSLVVASMNERIFGNV